MSTVINAFEQIENYPPTSGRLKFIRNGSSVKPVKVALIGDSTLDNDIWVQKDRPYREKTATVTHQAAQALATIEPTANYDIANFAIDGATTEDITRWCRLGKVVTDQDHPWDTRINQMGAAKRWEPDVVVLSVAGNNYREALKETLEEAIPAPQLLLRQTPEQAKTLIKTKFDSVKKILLEQYKEIIDELIADNSQLNRIVLMSQYYPELTQFTPYFIYTGFSHVARAEGIRQSAFTAMQDTMNELYRDILAYCASKDKEFVLVDVTSSMNPLDNNHTCQIEPNARGAKIMGRLIAEAVRYQYPGADDDDDDEVEESSAIAVLSLNRDKTLATRLLEDDELNSFEVKPLSQFINENRYRHVSHFFRAESSLATRYESAYHMVMGKDFDSQYKGLPAFGLLDVSLVTVAASYLWRSVALNDNVPVAFKIGAGIIAAPILLTKFIIGLVAMLTLSLPILTYHGIAKCFETQDAPAQNEQDPSALPIDDEEALLLK